MMEGWKKVTLEEVSTKIGDGLHGTPKYDEMGEYYFVNGNNLENGKIVIKTETKKISFEQYNKIKKELNDRTILVAINGTLGNLGFYSGEPIALGKSACYINLKNEVNKYFIRYVLEFEHFQNYAYLFATGSTIKNLGLKAVRKYPFLLPPVTTQLKIASILSAYDDLIENNLKRIKLLEEKAQLTYEEWFVRMKFPGHETTPINKETGLPEGWEKKAIKDLSKLVSGFAFKSKDFVEDGNYKLVTIKNVQEGVFINKTSDTLSIIPEKVKPEHLLKDGDIIMSLTGNVGRTCMVYGENYLLNQRVLKIQPFHFKSFMYWLLRSRKTIKELENLSNGAAQQNLSPINMGKHKVVIPSKEFLKRFSEVFDLQLNVSIELNKQNQLLKEARDILLPRLMTGMIDVEKMKLENLQSTTA